MQFSRRVEWHPRPNRLSIARRERIRAGGGILDLTESNPTRAAIPYPLDELAAILSAAARAPYEPEPLGLRQARAAIAATLTCSPDDIVITASTSEAYSFLFRLLADPGEEIATAVPSYPLLEHLAALERVALRPFPLEFHRRWEVDPARVEAAITPRTRAIAIVSPNNPTGSFVTRQEQDTLARWGLPLIADEVFFDYPIEADPDRMFRAVRDDVLTFSLGGLSKSCGLPHYKLAWIRVSGPAEAKRAALRALELIADNFLSVATPVQQALPRLLAIGAHIRDAISSRIRENLDLASRVLALAPSARLFPVEGGWSAVIRVPSVEPDEDLALRLLDAGVLVHPGYFFDFDRDGHLVVSLLTRPDVFAEGIRRLAGMIPA